MLGALRKELETEGFNLHGVQHFSNNLLAKQGRLGKIDPLEEDWVSIEQGLRISQSIGELDIGQSIIVQDGVIIGVEAIEGTDALIERCEPLLNKKRRAFLIKTCKPQQDTDLDLPTIGLKTVINAHKFGLSGIVVHAGNSLILDSKKVAQEADRLNIFIYGYNI